MSTHLQTTSQLHLLKQYQQIDGSFLDAAHTSSPLVTALILDALSALPSQPVLSEITKNAANYLLTIKDKNGVFLLPLGTVCMVLAALSKYNRNLIDGSVLAYLLQTLASREVAEGGPYFTLANGDSVYRQDNPVVDFGVNVAVAYFLNLHGVQLPPLREFVERAQTSQECTSQELDAPLVERLMSKLFPKLSSPYINLSTQARITRLPTVQLAWQLEDAAGGLVLSIEPVVKNETEENIFALIRRQARERFSVLSFELQQLALQQMEKSIVGNSNKQMSLMPLYLREALGRKGRVFSDSYIAELGFVNILFWTAFVIYDDFWDRDEAALPHILPTANVYTREFITFFTDVLAPSAGLKTFFHSLMDKLDAANTWETLHCRTPVERNSFKIPFHLPEFQDYEKKFEPASAHVLGSVVLFYQLGFPIDSWETKTLVSYFRNYLIPMQINDDLHDWQEDMRRGHISTVVAMLLEDLGTDRSELDLVSDLPELEQVFWSKTLPRAGALAHAYLDKARTALYGLPMFENRAPLEKFIISIEQSIDAALKERELTTDLLKNFQFSRS